MKRINNGIKTYDVGNGFCVDIEKRDGVYEAWLYHTDMGIKDFMFGLKESLAEFKKMVIANLETYEVLYNEYYN